MSRLRYNGVEFRFVRTISYSFGSELDPTNTDVLWNVYEMVCEGVPLNTGGEVAITNSIIADIQHKLGLPRKAITYQLNDDTTVISTTGIDAGMGPEVVTPPVITAVNSGAMLVRVHYRVRIRDCATGSPDPVVSLRWRQTETYNETWTCRLSTVGRIIVRSDAGQSADSFRDLATPNVQPDFVRINRRYTLSEKGTELAFEFEDEQRDRMPPYPALKASGSFVVQVDKGRRTGNCEVSLTGAKGTSRKELLVVAMRIALSKLNYEGVEFHTGAMFKEDLFEPNVSVAMRGMLPALKGGGIATAFAGAAAGVVIGATGGVQPPAVFPTVGLAPAGVSDNRPGIAPPIRERIAALLVAGFRDPCAAAAFDTELRSERGGGTPQLVTSEDGGIKTTLSTSVGPLPPFSGQPAVLDSAPYSHYHCESTYTLERGKGHLPATGVGPEGQLSSIVTLHGGRMQLHITWAAIRSGVPPVIPAFTSDDPNVVPLDGAITVNNVEMEADGVTPIHAVGGLYIYAIIDPSKVAILAATPPFLSKTVGLAAELVAQHTSNDVVRFQGAKNPNPLANPAATGEVPDNNVTQQLGGGPLGTFFPFPGSGFFADLGGGSNGLLPDQPVNP